MKFILTRREKKKWLLGITAVFFILFFTSWHNKRQLTQLDNGVSSMFADRLVPSVDIYLISEELYESRLRSQQLFLSSEFESMQYDHRKEFAHIDSLIGKYGLTFLVEEEKEHLHRFFSAWKGYKELEVKIEESLAQGDRLTAYRLFSGEGETLFRKLGAELHFLSQLQGQVGKQLSDQSHQLLLGTVNLNNLQWGIFLIMGILAHYLLFVDKKSSLSRHQLPLN